MTSDASRQLTNGGELHNLTDLNVNDNDLEF